jgi:hypothetical protein
LKDPEKVIVAATPQAIAEALAEVDQNKEDLHWVALLNYELGFWFEPKLSQFRNFEHPPFMVICFRSARWLSRVQLTGGCKQPLPACRNRRLVPELPIFG